MTLPEAKPLDILINTIYTNAPQSEIARRHNVDPTDLQLLYKGYTSNPIRERVLTAIAKYRGTAVKVTSSDTFAKKPETPKRPQPSQTQASPRKKGRDQTCVDCDTFPLSVLPNLSKFPQQRHQSLQGG